MNKEELEKVEQLIEQKDSEQLKDLLAGLHPADTWRTGGAEPRDGAQ